eukprot:TRINITY_DN3754_c0_g1_i12.p1 TRINITY_DN3754_c0_g1~~TRINITY_DN3754_c0_g1_i12.p1  ORF type:complete len:126 (-),score=12.57 TRINITY_DN3754_c0_g1_i12:270-647(-)
MVSPPPCSSYIKSYLSAQEDIVSSFAEINEQVASQFTELYEPFTTLTTEQQHHLSELITLEEVSAAIKKMSPMSSPSPDQLVIKIYQSHCLIIAPLLVSLFNTLSLSDPEPSPIPKKCQRPTKKS